MTYLSADLLAQMTRYVATMPCDRRASWDEASMAIADSPNGPDKDQAWNDLYDAQARCECVPCVARRALRQNEETEG